jgi:3-phenylpropionate/trans-cinnamate dioxygenase ferredoxin reductase subunit
LRATVTGDAVVEFDEVPAEVRMRGNVVSLVDLTPDIVEVTIAFGKRLTYLPGQYVKVTFRGLPSRDYSPTLRADGSGDLNEIVLHIRREPGGTVSSELGRRIRPGSDVQVKGPFGHAYHRLAPGRLVLVSTGTGWAPIWAVARASRMREPDRPMVVVAGARHAANLYMRRLSIGCANGARL